MSRTLRRDMYGLHAVGFPTDQVKQPDPDPLAAARYSCVYWVDHLRDWDSSKSVKHEDILQDGGSVDRFLRKKYIYWLEALGLLKGKTRRVTSGQIESGRVQMRIYNMHLGIFTSNSMRGPQA